MVNTNLPSKVTKQQIVNEVGYEIASLDNQEKMIELLQILYTSQFNPSGFDWGTFFGLRRTGELFSTKFDDYSTTQTGIGEFMNDSEGKKCVPSTDKVKGQDDFENHNAFWYTLCNFTVDTNGVKIPTAIEGQSTFKRTGEVDVGVLTPPLYWGEEKVTGGYIKHFSDSEHPTKRPDLTLTLMPHCKDNKMKPMPYGIVPVYYAGTINSKLYSSSGLPVTNFMSYEKLHTDMVSKGAGYVGAGSERSAYLKNFLWIKYGVLSSQARFRGHVDTGGYQYQNTAAAENVNYVTILKTQAANLYVGLTVSIGKCTNKSNLDRGNGYMRDLADKVRITKIEDADTTHSRVYVEGKTFTTTTDVYISSMPLHSGQTDGVLGNDGYVANDGKHSYRIQGVEDGIGAYMVSGNEVMNKEDNGGAGRKVTFYNRNGADYTNTAFATSWTKIGEYSKDNTDDFWLGEETVDLDTGSSYFKTVGGSDSTGVGDRIYFGGPNNGWREYLTRGGLRNGGDAGLSCVYVWHGLTGAYWNIAVAVS